MMNFKQSAQIGIGYRYEIHDWTLANLESFDVLEITIDHYLVGGTARREAIAALVGQIPLIAHGIGLSVGTAVLPDQTYLDNIARALDELEIEWYSEHLALTKVPGIDLANLLPLPRTEEVAEQVIDNVNFVKSRIPAARFGLENISYMFDYPESTLGEAEFLNLICRETGSYIMLDVENVVVNSRNYHYDPRAFVDSLPADQVLEIHMAGGFFFEQTRIDSHSQPVSPETLGLLDYVLQVTEPRSIILERDDRLGAVDEIAADVSAIRNVVGRGYENAKPAVA
jgi:uncharacterized protein